MFSRDERCRVACLDWRAENNRDWLWLHGLMQGISKFLDTLEAVFWDFGKRLEDNTLNSFRERWEMISE